MRHLMLVLALLILLCQSVGAEEHLALNEPWPCLYLFGDEAFWHPCVDGTGYFTFYCCALPGYRPIGTLYFSISLSSDNLALSDVVFPPEAVVISGGDLPGDVAVSIDCNSYDWNVVFSATLFVGTESEEAVVIGPFTGESAPLSIANDGTEEYLHCMDLMINDELCNPVEAPGYSWGALKSLYQ